VLVESWYVGLKVVAWLLSIWLDVLFWGFWIVLVGFVLFLLCGCRNSKHQESVRIKEQQPKEENEHLSCILQKLDQFMRFLSDLSGLILYPTIIISGSTLVIALPFKDAKEFAEEQMSLYQQHGCQNENQKYHCASLIDLSDNKVLIQGILISANDNRVAIYNNKLEIWPLLDNYIIRQNKPVNMDEVGDKE
jgi:hypothetical protein